MLGATILKGILNLPKYCTQDAVCHGANSSICLHINAHLKTARPTMAVSMTTQPSLDLIAERVERLLVRHEELQRTNTLLTDQVSALTQERDLLRLRLQAARARVDALIERLPANQGE